MIFFFLSQNTHLLWLFSFLWLTRKKTGLKNRILSGYRCEWVVSLYALSHWSAKELWIIVTKSHVKKIYKKHNIVQQKKKKLSQYTHTQAQKIILTWTSLFFFIVTRSKFYHCIDNPSVICPRHCFSSN